MPTPTYTLGEIAARVGGELAGDSATPITGVAGIREAKNGEITFFADSRYEKFLHTTGASAVIGPPGIECSKPAILSANPYLAFAKVLTMFAEKVAEESPLGVHATAVVDADVQLGKNVFVGPHCQIRSGSRIGIETRVLMGSYIGRNVMIGANCLIYPNVTICDDSRIGDRVIIHPGAVIGADGFGFIRDGDHHHKIPQVGNVVIEDDVELGANATVDRATVGSTRICKGAKIDNLVMIAHNCVVGKNSLLAGQVGISGSTEVGEDVVLAGQAGLVGHLKIGNRVVVGAQAGVTKSIPDGTTVSGYPAREHGLARKLYGFTKRLPELYKRLRELEKKVEKIEGGGNRGQATDND